MLDHLLLSRAIDDGRKQAGVAYVPIGCWYMRPVGGLRNDQSGSVVQPITLEVVEGGTSRVAGARTSRFFASSRWSQHFIIQAAYLTLPGRTCPITAPLSAALPAATALLLYWPPPRACPRCWTEMDPRSCFLACVRRVLGVCCDMRIYNLMLHNGEWSPDDSAFASDSSRAWQSSQPHAADKLTDGFACG